MSIVKSLVLGGSAVAAGFAIAAVCGIWTLPAAMAVGSLTAAQTLGIAAAVGFGSVAAVSVIQGSCGGWEGRTRRKPGALSLY